MGKKVVVTLLASILVLVVCAGAIIALVHSSKARSNIPSDPGSSPLGAASNISKLCLPAMYQDSCERTLSQISPNGSVSPADVLKTFVEVAIKEFESAVSRSADVTKGKILASDTAAVPLCQTLLNDGLEYLKDLLASLQGKDVQSLVSDSDTIKHTISASMTHMYTCVDSFDDPALNSQMNSILNNATEMSSNALAVIASISSVEEELESDLNNLPAKGANRRLMGYDLDEEGYPTWLSAGDRKLLQAESVKPNVVVAQDGSGNYKRINDAIRNMPVKTGRYVIHVKAGVYNEYVMVPKGKDNLFMYGDGRERTIITGDHSNGTNYKTSDSATFAVEAVNFTAKDIGFRNTAGPRKLQAVAFRIKGDFGAFFNCRFDGYQDTLYVHCWRQFFRDCIITGTVDFIFGNSAAVFQNCGIYVNTPMDSQKNTVTASGRADKNMPSALVIQNCRIKASQGLNIVRTQSYLGRPWKEYSRAVVMESFIDSVINPVGWLEWTGNFALNTLYYAEYANTGPRSSTVSRVKWHGFHVIGWKEAIQFTPGRFIGGNSWVRERRIPFDSGLIKKN